MAGQTQLRLSQMTGSVVNFKPTAVAAGDSTATFTANDLSGSFKYFAQALSNIHGSTEFGSQAPGLFSFDTANVDIVFEQDQVARKIHLDSEGTGATSIDIDSAGGVDVDAAGLISLESSAGSIEAKVVDGQTVSLGLAGASQLVLTPHGTAGSEKASLVVTSGDAADAILIDAVAGGVKVDAGGGVLALDGSTGIDIGKVADAPIDIDASTFNLDASGVMSIDVTGGASNITSTTDAAGEDFTISLAGATDSSLIIASSGTGADAMDINATAGGIDVDAELGVTIDSVAAGITVGGILADGQVLQLGKSGAAEMTFSPHGTAANEKIGLLNTAGSAADAILMEATAGGFDINAGTSFDLDAQDAVSLDSVNGSMTMGAILADGQTLKLGKNGAVEMVFTPHGTAANEKFLLTNTSGDAVDAISLTAVAGGIELDAAGLVSVNSTGASIEVGDVLADGQTLKLGKNGAVEVIIAPHGTAASEKYSVINTGGDGLDSMVFSAVAGGMTLDSALALDLNSAAQIKIGSDAVAQSILIGGAGARPVISLGSTAAVALQGVAKKAELTGSQGIVGLSGSFGIGFASDGAMTSDGNNGMLFANSQEFGAFRAKSLFTAATTVIGAFNALADSVSGTEPTLFSLQIASDQARGVLQTVTKIAGDAGNLGTHAPNKVQVMVNGQVLRTGSAADFTNYACDYVVNGDGTGRQLKFNFLLKTDDLVQVWDFS